MDKKKLIGFKCLGTKTIILILPYCWETPPGYHQLRESVHLLWSSSQ